MRTPALCDSIAGIPSPFTARMSPGLAIILLPEGSMTMPSTRVSRRWMRGLRPGPGCGSLMMRRRGRVRFHECPTRSSYKINQATHCHAYQITIALNTKLTTIRKLS